MNYDKMEDLLNQLRSEIEEYGSFSMREIGQQEYEVKYQTGVFRTNCLDCLDRTNLTQSLIAKEVLQYQLKSLGIMGNVTSDSTYMSSFRNLWADNGDYISTQYAGTGALKGSFFPFFFFLFLFFFFFFSFFFFKLEANQKCVQGFIIGDDTIMDYNEFVVGI